MATNAFQCKQCGSIWTRHTLLDDACPECKGEIIDITNTPKGQKFLSIISVPAELRASKTDQPNIYATGPSAIYSATGKSS